MISRMLDFGTEKLQQCAALPYVVSNGSLLILIVTTRRTGQWVLPKGWTSPKQLPHIVAEKEAFEEAGVVGEISNQSIGSYSETKRLHTLAFATCTLDVFPLSVEYQQLNWPEKGQRSFVWLPPASAASRVSNPGLAKIIHDFR